MKAFLMYPDRDVAKEPLPAHAGAVIQDLELNTILKAMAGDDEFLANVARNAMFSGFQNDAPTVLYRQDILKDCLQNPAVARELYSLAVTAFERKSTHWLGIFSRNPSGVLHDSVELLEWFTKFLRQLRQLAVTQSPKFTSRGFTNFFAMLQSEFSDDYFAVIENHLRTLRFRGGVLESVELGLGMEATHVVLRQSLGKNPGWFQRLLGKGPKDYTFRLADRDEAGARIMSDMEAQGVNLVANALAQSTDHILSFFDMLRTELAFYVACLNLHERLAARNVAVSFPQPDSPGTHVHHFQGLVDISLVLTTSKQVVGIDMHGDGKNLVIITGANQGGKSSFLRSVGQAQLLMQCGMFVAADSFEAEMCTGLFTHYKREEDASMTSGKLDEELSRMSAIIDAVSPRGMVLFNESFSSTNEREGSEIARQIIAALLDRGIQVLFVTHLFDFAHGIFAQAKPSTLFLRAVRRQDGSRPFKLLENEPLETSYGRDLYEQVFSCR